MRNNLKKKVCSLLVATLMTTATFANGFTYGGITVSAEESNVTVQNSGNVETSGEKTYSDINDSTGSGVNTGDVETSTVETTTGETVETSTDETTMPETTVEPTTPQPTHRNLQQYRLQQSLHQQRLLPGVRMQQVSLLMVIRR